MTSLNKYIALSGLCSRRGADLLIKQGRVKINSKIAKTTDKVDDTTKVFVDAKLIKVMEKKIYLAFNKPYGVICTTDKKSSNTIMDYLKIPERVFPVGRLDVKSKGLILLTNDGNLTNLILKSKKVEKEYIVTVDKILNNNFLEKMRKGIRLDGRLTLPAKVQKTNNKTFQIILLEGRKRQIRRMCEKNHYNVTELKRIRIGEIKLDSITEGQFITIDAKRIYDLLKL